MRAPIVIENASGSSGNPLTKTGRYGEKNSKINTHFKNQLNFITLICTYQT
jgi:hypothetical protein